MSNGYSPATLSFSLQVQTRDVVQYTRSSIFRSEKNTHTQTRHVYIHHVLYIRSTRLDTTFSKKRYDQDQEGFKGMLRGTARVLQHQSLLSKTASCIRHLLLDMVTFWPDDKETQIQCRITYFWIIPTTISSTS
jgi:hypothetical protein